MSECTIDSGDNYPYRPQTFGLITHLAPLIRDYSARLGVPVIAVAGSVADEYNTRRGWRFGLDWLQDHLVISKLPSFAIEVDRRLGFSSKLLNATRNDLGAGNINLQTAQMIYAQFRPQFPVSLGSWSELVNFIMTDEGTVLIAALVIRKGMLDMAPYLTGRSLELQEAILVTYYKQGPDYVARFKARLGQGSPDELTPGEGCRAFHQRIALMRCLGGT